MDRRLYILKKARDYACEQVYDSSCLSNECFEKLQKPSNSEEVICLTLAKIFLEDAALDIKHNIEEQKESEEEIT